MRAVWKDVVLAESDDTVVVEGNHYFPRESLNQEYFTESDHRSVCPWKGEASYLSVSVGGEVNADAAWEYESPSIRARMIKDRVRSGTASTSSASTRATRQRAVHEHCRSR
jgi:uncharacterized protein (DUF427 family)